MEEDRETLSGSMVQFPFINIIIGETIMKDKLLTALKTKRFWGGLGAIAGVLLGATGALTVDAVGNVVCTVFTCV